MGASLIKMMAAIVFLIPILINNSVNALINIISFFIPYFLFLVFETYYAVKLIKRNNIWLSRGSKKMRKVH
jgi:hypothetical protein